MKQRVIHIGSLAILVMSAGLTWGGVEGSKHDFSNRQWSSGDRCGACHTPHIESPPQAVPLWDSQADLNQRFGTALGALDRLGNGTVMCLRCHDGTLAKDNIGGVTRKKRFANNLHPALFSSAHGANDHPVGVAYPLIDRYYRAANTVAAAGAVRIPKGRVECSSCHDPHDAAGEKYMLVMSNERSALCLACHNK